MTTAGEQGQAAGVCRVTGQGRACFCAGQKGGSPPGPKRVKNVPITIFRLPRALQTASSGWRHLLAACCPWSGAGCLLSPLFSRRAPPRCSGLSELGVSPPSSSFFSAFLSSPLNNKGVGGIYTSAW